MPKKAQGSSLITPRKERELYGLTHMRVNQFKSFGFNEIDRIVFADVFSGNGNNVLEDQTEVEGSPVQITQAVVRASTTGPKARALLDKKFIFIFNDIRRDAVEKCREIVTPLFSPIASNIVSPQFWKMEASAAIAKLHRGMLNDPRMYAYLVLDPNGPKAFPRKEVLELCRCFGNRVDIVTNLSATAIYRTLRLKETHPEFNVPWLEGIEGIDDGYLRALTNNRFGWIRRPIEGDPQRWFIIPTFGRVQPWYDWHTQGYVKIHSSEGFSAMRAYSWRLSNVS